MLIRGGVWLTLNLSKSSPHAHLPLHPCVPTLGGHFRSKAGLGYTFLQPLGTIPPPLVAYRERPCVLTLVSSLCVLRSCLLSVQSPCIPTSGGHPADHIQGAAGGTRQHPQHGRSVAGPATDAARPGGSPARLCAVGGRRAGQQQHPERVHFARRGFSSCRQTLSLPYLCAMMRGL